MTCSCLDVGLQLGKLTVKEYVLHVFLSTVITTSNTRFVKLSTHEGSVKDVGKVNVQDDYM